MADVDVLRAIAEARLMQPPDADSILTDLQAIKNRCMEPDEDGRPIDAPSALRALDLLGKYHGLWNRDGGGQKQAVSITILK